MKNVRQYSFRGESKPLSAWARELGLPAGLVRARLRRGWDFNAFAEAQARLDDRLTYKGETMTVEQWFRRLGLDPRVLRKTFAPGVTVKKLLLLPRLRRPTHPHARQVEIGGTAKTIAEWAKEKGLNKRQLRRRLDSGWLPAFAVDVR